jgi:hypothetical protein
MVIPSVLLVLLALSYLLEINTWWTSNCRRQVPAETDHDL